MKDSFEQQWRERFERFARTYDEEHHVSGWSERGLQIRFAKCMQFLSSRSCQRPMKVLDVGCGAGTYVRYLALHEHHVVGLDYSLPTIRKAMALDTKRVGQYLCGEVYHLPFANNQFDVVLAIGIMQTVSQPQLALCEISRVVRGGGIIIVEALNAWELIAIGKRISHYIAQKPIRLRTYSPLEMRRWINGCELKIIKKEPIILLPRQLGQHIYAKIMEHYLRTIASIPLISMSVTHSFLYFVSKQRSKTLDSTR